MDRTPTLPLATGASILGAALLVGWGLSLPFQVDVGEKTLSGLEWEEPSAAVSSVTGRPRTAPYSSAPAAGPLTLRMVDAGGVGIPADTASWGTTYSHATHAFDQLVLPGPPWLDGDEARRIRADWRAYVARMAEMGNNAVVLDAFLETINFDQVGSGLDVYPAAAPLRGRHLAYRAFYDGLARDAEAVGMDSYLKTDLPAVTPSLERYLRNDLGGATADDARFWDVYAAAFDELFETMPRIAGVVIRIGEAGPLFNADGNDYESYMGVRTPAQLRLMLRTLLPVFERHRRTLIFRSWSVGLGPLGDLHHDPGTYLSVLGPIESPALVVSTKFVAGDYFGFLPLNPTLLVGDHRRIVEYQARREYEGFGALPNYLGHAHRAALHQVMAANPNLVGTSLWTQEGGPLRAGPLSLYDVTGFWRWTDANVYATSRLAVHPDADPRALAVEWARVTFDADSATAMALADILETSREAVEKGLYVRPFARARVEMAGIEVPPILWIFEWDQVGGWSSVLSTLYRTVRHDLDAAIAEGYEAVRLTRRMRDRLRSLEPGLGRHPDWDDLMRSLDYQASLYGTLAEFRAFFLGYHRWLDEGGDAASWRRAAGRFTSAAVEHETAFGGDLDFPAFDFSGAVTLADRTRRSTSLPRRGLAPLGLGLALLVVTYGVVLARALTGRWSIRHVRAHGSATVGPLLLAAVPGLAIIPFRGPDYFWLLFWTEDTFRLGLFATATMAILWSLASSYRVGQRLSGCRWFAAGSVMVAGGATLVVLGGLLPDLETTLRALDEPLQLLPMTTAIVNGITHYGGLPDALRHLPGIVGVAVVSTGLALRRTGSPASHR